MKQKIALENHCTCLNCKGTGFTNDLRCQSIIKIEGTDKIRQCGNPATHEVDGIPCCQLHYAKQYRDFKKEFFNTKAAK